MAAIFTLYGKNYWFWLLFERSLFVKLKANSWIQFHPKYLFMLIFMLILCLKSLTVKTQKIHSFFQIILFILGYFPFGAVCCYVISLMQVLSKLFCVFINFECILQPCSIYASSFTLVAISIERLDLKFIIVNVKV